MLPELPQLEQRHWDLIGLGTVGFALFFATVFYLGWDGGRVGEAVANGFLLLFGSVGYLVPIALFAAGALMVLKPMLPSVRPFRSGAICLFCALTLGLAAGSFGMGPDRPDDSFLTDADQLRSHGGLLGQALFWTSRTLFQTAGAHLLFLFLLLAGVLLLTGASIAGVLRATRESVTMTTQRVRRSTSVRPPQMP